MKMKLLLSCASLALCLPLAPPLLVADAPQTAWTRVIGDSQHLEECYCVRPTADEGYILAGRKSLPTHGAYSDLYLVKTDASGAVSWEQSYDLGINGHARANAVEQAPDGGYIAAGWADNSNGNTDGYIIKVDSSGDLIWHYLYGDQDERDEFFNALALTADGGLIAAGSTDTAEGDVGAYIARLNGTGGIVWQYYYGAEGNEYANAVEETTDGGFIFCGSTSSEEGYGINDEAVYLVKLQSTGSVLWEKTFDYSEYGDEVGESVRQTTDGGYILAGWYEQGADPGSTLLLKLNASGIGVWARGYNWSGADIFSSVCQSADGGYTACGRTNSFGYDSYDMLVFHVDSSGDYQWMLNFGGSDYDAGYSIRPVGADGCIIGGKENNLGGQTGTGMYLVRLGTYDPPVPTPEPTSMPSPTPPPFSRSAPWIHDYNGDGTSDIAVFREEAGLWAVRGITRAYFGGADDIPVPGDYNGDGTTEIGIFRSETGLWAIRGVTRWYYGSGEDLPLAGDYDGDGTWEPGIFRDVSGLWAISGMTRAYFGTGGDIPVPGYYRGNDTGRDLALYRPALGLWAIRGVSRVYFGGSGDTPVPGDYTGSGSWTPAVFRSSTGLWAVPGVTRAYFGGSSDMPVPGDHDGDGTDEIGIFRSSSGLWAVPGTTRAYFGGLSDIPVVR